MNNKKYRAVIFDLGGVVFDSPIVGLMEYAKELNQPASFFGKVFSYGGDKGSFIEFEKGTISESEFKQRFKQECFDVSGVTIDSDRIIEILSQPKPRKEMIYAIRKLRESGLTVASITNNFAIGTTLEQEERRDQLKQLFDVLVESCVVNIRKPSPQIFEYALQEIRKNRPSNASIEYSDCIFLDDLGVNLKTAKNLGIYSIKVEADYLKAIQHLQHLFPNVTLMRSATSNL